MQARIAVVGAGLVGCAAALALEQSFPGETVHVAPPSNGDERTTALLMDAVGTLDRLGVWDEARPHAAPLRTMQLLDGSSRLVRARPLDFEAREVGLEQFGFNVRNDALVTVMERLIAERRVPRAVEAARRNGEGWSLLLDDGSELRCEAVVAADGRDSRLREAAGIGARRWSYDQVALVTTFAHELPHEDRSVEFHTETGPCTQVPLLAAPEAPHRSSLVCVVRGHEADRIAALSRAEQNDEIAARLHHQFGAITVERPLAGYPLRGLIADAFGRDGVFLVGEAAHVFPPIGAQGANLGFRDIVDCVATLARDSEPVRASERYADARRADVVLRTGAVDALNRSLLASFLPVHVGRALASEVIARSAGLRRALMRAGLAR